MVAAIVLDKAVVRKKENTAREGHLAVISLVILEPCRGDKIATTNSSGTNSISQLNLSPRKMVCIHDPTFRQ